MQGPRLSQVPLDGLSHDLRSARRTSRRTKADCRNMQFPLFLSFLPALFGLATAVQSEEVRTLVVQREVIMRVPVRPRPLPNGMEWSEHKGPKCISSAAIRGAAISGREHVDFLLYGRERVRAKLADDCPALDFYSGFYLTPEDGTVCALRDSIHSRIGSSCRIERFRRLAPRRKE
jgi:hypothetical protein